jgi:excinuclease ABC subunit C
MSLEDKIRQLPTSPGVYLMRDADGTIIYVGKARSLRQRVRSYFNASGDSRHHVRFLVARVSDIEVLLTDTEKEALLLENTLIKQHRPRYNLDLKDDKTYFSLRLDPREEFPRFSLVRKMPRDGARYFGPYSSAAAAREVLRQMTRMFPLRHYPLAACMARKRPCLYHQIGQCSAPCQGLISKADYQELVESAMLFLEGKGRQLVTEFKRRMNEAAEKMMYEEAARWRNLLRSIQITVEKQKVVLQGGDSDVIGFHRQGSRIELAILFIRGGVLSGSRLFALEWELDDADGISAFLNQHYTTDSFIPAEILLPRPIEEISALNELLNELKGSKVSIAYPRRGTKRSNWPVKTPNLQCGNVIKRRHRLRQLSTSFASASTCCASLHESNATIFPTSRDAFRLGAASRTETADLTRKVTATTAYRPLRGRTTLPCCARFFHGVSEVTKLKKTDCRIWWWWMAASGS